MAGLACARICFNTQPPEGGCSHLFYQSVTPKEFQHTAARRRLLVVLITEALVDLFQHTAARRRLVSKVKEKGDLKCFNTQPPEGGCSS